MRDRLATSVTTPTDPTATGGDAVADVALLAWPRDEVRRDACRRSGVPVLLLVAPGDLPPFDTGELEDWAHTTAQPLEIHARLSTLSGRAQRLQQSPPELDPNGVIRVGARWLALSPLDARLMRVLLDRRGSVVDVAVLASAGWGRAPSGSAVRGQLHRLRRTIEPLGLCIRNVRNHGYVLDEQRSVAPV